MCLCVWSLHWWGGALLDRHLGLPVHADLLHSVPLTWCKEGGICHSVQPCMVLFCLLPVVPQREMEERAAAVIEREEPCLLSLLCHRSGCSRSWGCLKTFLLGSQCSFVSRSFIPHCLEPWLLVLSVYLCSLFTSCSVNAVHTAQREPVHVWRLRVCTTAVLFFTTFRQQLFPRFLCLLTQEWRPVARAF